MSSSVIVQQENTIDAEPCVPGVMRIQVSEEIAEIWLAERDENGNILKFEKNMFSGLTLESISTTFHIGGKFEKRQRAEGLHLWFDIVYSEDMPVTKASVNIQNNPDIFIAEPVYLPKAAAVEMNDPYYVYQWHYNNSGLYGFLEGIDIGLEEAWNTFGVFGNREVIVAVVDSGIDFSHEDLIPNLWVNEAELNGTPGVDDDGNGYKDDIHGYNFVINSAEVVPDHHGTHVAGTIGAVNNNGIGVCGIAGGYCPDKPGVRIMGLQILDDNEENNLTNNVKVFQYAAENGATIVNNSWGYLQPVTIMPEADKKAIDYFVRHAGLDENGNQTGPMKGGLAIFAAGNSAVDLDYPAAYEKAMAVAAIGPLGKAAYYTNYGDWVDICAPGGDQQIDNSYGGVYSTNVGNTYASFQGTSMACPHVSGVAALVLSACGGPGYTKEDLWNSIMEGTDSSIYDYNEDMTGLLGVGLIKLPLALATLNTTPPENVTSVVAESNANTIYLTANVPADDTGDAYYYHVYVSKTEIDPSKLSTYERHDIAINKQTLMEDGTRKFSIRGLEFETEYHFAVVAGDFAGNMSDTPYILNTMTKANTLPEITAKMTGKTELKSSETTSYLFVTKEYDDFHTVTCWLDEGNTGENLAIETLLDGSHLIKIDGSKFSEGDYRCWFVASDQYGGEARYEIVFTLNVNTPPALSRTLEDVIINGVGNQVSIDLSNYFTDQDGEILQYTTSVADASIAGVSVNSSNATLTSKGLGMTKIEITAKDGSGENVSSEFNLLVRDDSKPYDLYPNPVLDVLNIRAGTEGEAKIEVISHNGETVYSENALIGGFDPLKADLSTLAPGRYNVVITPATGEKYQTIIVKL